MENYKTYKVKPIKSYSHDNGDKIVLANQGRAKLVSCESIGKVACYDLEVDHPDHLFILSNNIIVSNSSKHTCLDEDTMVMLGDGLHAKKIKDLVPLVDYVLGSDKEGNLRPVMVLQLFDQGLQDCYKWAFRKNRKEQAEVICTPAHKFLNNEGTILPLQTYIDASKSYKKFVVKGINNVSTLNGAYHEPLAFIAGIFLGDGIRFTKGTSVRFSCADSLLISYLNDIYFANKFIRVIKRKRGFDYAFTDMMANAKTLRDPVTGRFIKQDKSKSRIKSLLQRLGWEGKYCTNKFIPDEVLSWDTSSLIDFIKGYFVTDGSIFVSRRGQIAINFASTSLPIVERLKYILFHKFGICTASITTTLSARKRALYSLGVFYYSEVKKFLDIIGDIPGIKGTTAKQLYPSIIYKLDKSNCRNPALHLKSYTYVGKKHCYDIMVDHPDHLFVLKSGLICSNSGMFKGKKSISGLPYIIQFLEGYDSGKDKAAVSEFDGEVEDIIDAPQGGKYIIINGTEHYVEPNTEIFVKKGDEVERGDILSDGLANPADITRLRGIGEGRKYVSERFKQLLDDSGAKAHKRNTETFARGFIDKVRITNPDGLGDWLPDDIVSYNALEANYVPEEDSKYISVKNHDAVNKYLQKPVLHYTIGTKLTKKMVDHIRDSGITDEVLVSDTEPGFEADFVRLREAPTEGETDFIGRGVAPYQKANYIDAAVRGLQSNIKENVNPFTRMSQPDFAENIKTTGKF